MVDGRLLSGGLLVLAALTLTRPSTRELAAHRMALVGGQQVASQARPGRDGRPASRSWPGLRRATPVSVTAFAAELVAACLDAGATPAAALEAAGANVGDPLGTALSRAGEALAAGATVHEALPEDGALAPLAPVFRRSLQTGSAMSDQLIGIAAQLRADEQYERLAKAQRVGVLSALPLGLCLLPAFVLLAVVPAVLGLGTGLLP